ncbi:MAG: cell division protein SepF [Elainellaceae cyanobacterium]
MSNIFSKLKDFVGFNEPLDYEYDYAEVNDNAYQNLYQTENTESEEEPRPSRVRDRSTTVSELSNRSGSTVLGSNVIGMPGALNGMSEVVVIEPQSFEEMPQVIRSLRERKSVVLNLTNMDADQAQRSVDFIAGGTYAIDGHQERIGESIFLFTPNCVQVSTQPGMPADVPTSPSEVPSYLPTPTPAWGNQARMA